MCEFTILEDLKSVSKTFFTIFPNFLQRNFSGGTLEKQKDRDFSISPELIKIGVSQLEKARGGINCAKSEDFCFMK